MAPTASGLLSSAPQRRCGTIIRWAWAQTNMSSPLTPMAIRSEQVRSEEHTSELQSLMRISYAVFCLKKKTKNKTTKTHNINKPYNKDTTSNIARHTQI